ncbi:MAG: T9SS type A sorting domain-containing protein [Tenuifilaceae bacterium]|jgi:hypothetical protein|nr:T9SS type A sorting domain-containing protein [Tenuifilaceae bacterium]
MIRTLGVALLLFIFLPGIAQPQSGGEVLVGLESLSIPSAPIQKRVTKSVLELPFFDDFSRGLSYPVSTLWDGMHVLVNPSYAINPPTIGVATFDALSSKGTLHPGASTLPFSSDTLTSNTINLQYPGDTTVYISFHFQPQGLGYEPGPRDSLLLEFYNVEKDAWEGAWAAWVDFEAKKLYQHNKLRDRKLTVESDTLNRTFFRVHFPIIYEQFLNSAFRFRFRNIASISSNSDVPGLRGNSDHWNIDLVYINRGRSYTDTLLNDVTFAKPLGSILNNYESLPWLHFNQTARSAELTNPLVSQITYRNLGKQIWNITRLFQVYNHSTNQQYNHSGGNSNISGLTEFTYSRLYLYDLTSSWADSARFTFSSFLTTDFSEATAHLRWNDTIRYTQNFLNYYAYDDGSAESGYGLYGEGTQNGRVAVKFTSYKADWLVGVYMYFNRTFGDANQKYFKLAVWDDNNGKPGNVVYVQEGVRPIFTDSLNRFTLFKLNEKLWLEPGTFYVGWIQITTDMLNVGFDRNRNIRQKHFYNIDGNWKNTQFEGALMVRPVFGKLTEWPTSNPLIIERETFTLYPNPAKEYIRVDLPNPSENTIVNIYGITGQFLLSVRYSGQPIDISRLPSGTYLVRVTEGGRILGTQKLVVAKW